MFRVLIVEDTPESFELVRRALGTSIQLEWAKSQREAGAILQNPQKRSFDLIILDANLPDGDGFTMCSLLQTQDNFSSTPVIMLTSKNSVSDKVLAFSVGATDFVSKPFDPLELKARVEARLRKRERAMQSADVVVCNGLEIRKGSQKAFLTNNGVMEPLDLTPIEFKMLLYMASRPNNVVTREKLLDEVWGENVHVYSRSVDTHISKLRKKLGDKSHYIASVHGMGYRFDGQAEEEAKAAPFAAVMGDKGGLQYGRLA